MPPFPSKLPDDLHVLEAVVKRHEEAKAPLKENNEATIIWADAEKKNRTTYSIVYLHGFAASYREADPLHKVIAKKFGCNLYLARLHGHGLKQDNIFEKFSTQKLLNSAIDACRIGQKIGENVILMGTSAGAALALFAAGSKKCKIPVKALLLYSPLIHFYGVRSLLLENQICRTLVAILRGKNYRYSAPPLSEAELSIWYPCFPLRAALTLGEMIQYEMISSLYAKIHCPAFIGYYFQNRCNHDRIVSTRAIINMAAKLGSPVSKQKIINFPSAGSHVIASSLLSESVESVIEETELFLQQKVGL